MAKIAIATLIAIVVAGVVLVVAVLPAEYGIDPLGTGKRLRLTDLATAAATYTGLKVETTAQSTRSLFASRGTERISASPL